MVCWDWGDEEEERHVLVLVGEGRDYCEVEFEEGLLKMDITTRNRYMKGCLEFDTRIKHDDAWL